MQTPAGSVVAVLSLATLLLWPRPSAAMEIEQFDGMAAEDRRHYVAFMVKEAEKLLLELDAPDLAERVHHLFHDVPEGETRSAGDATFEAQLVSARAFAMKMAMPGKVSWNQMEFVLFQTLIKNGIRPPPAFFKQFPRGIRNRVFYQRPE